MSRQIRLMDAFEYRARVESDPIVIVPVGSFEQHGPHMPLCVDELLATAVAEEVASRVDGLVGPTIGFGYKSQQRSGGGDDQSHRGYLHKPGARDRDRAGAARDQEVRVLQRAL